MKRPNIEESSQTISTSPLKTEKPKIKVLIVDDDPKITKSAELYLPDFTLFVTNSGEEALKSLKENKIDVIVSDYNMPGLNGIQLKEMIDKLGYKIPIIVMSGEMNKEISIKYANNHVFHIFEKPFMFSDLSIKIKEAFNQSKDSLTKQKFELLGKNAGQIIHDVNNGLTIIESSAEIGKDQTSEEKIKKHFERTLRACDKIKSLVDKYKKYLHNKEEIQFQEINIVSFMESLKEDIQPFYSNKNLNISMDYEENCKSIFLLIEPDLFRQTILNLISNSYYEIKTETNPWIKINLESKNNKFFINITDSGPGIPPHIKAKLFHEGNSSKGTHGTGMGLFYCKTIVEIMYGNIYLNESHQNTCFTVELPVYSGVKNE